MMPKHKNFILVILLFSLSVSADNSKLNLPLPSACSDEMSALVKQYPETLVVHVKGLVCSSCAIGIRLKLSKLDGVDTSKFSNGIKLDSSNQYVILAVKNDVNFSQVFESIKLAGYDPLHICYMNGGKIEKINFPT